MKAKLKSWKAKELLFKNGYGQNELASRVGISSGYMSQVFSGDRFPSEKLCGRLMKKFKCEFAARFTLEVC